MKTQYNDGGWVAVVDTMWNVHFLSLCNGSSYKKTIADGVQYLNSNTSSFGLWGRSKRDFDRIPVSGIALSRLRNLVSQDRLKRFEQLWVKEFGSLTYKAAYSLMAFRANDYSPEDPELILKTMRWIEDNQRDDGAFGPWKNHPVDSDTYCTSIALLGMLTYPKLIAEERIVRACEWLLKTQLPSGIWPFHEIEDGGSWALRALVEAKRQGFIA